ncbi:hypothetical protein JMJ77_0000463 [Colletotrichum scovillei]|uniref:Secreted protein n=1 Tax=Colletotrichum scovillei TaxID=1209932 RepID=A0A9P7RD03_9PEZI|nr:hypothetical protein JMJ77_0000463 [Colletotrichum scovillei]KAG7071631.1 hypothetical protein JMJ76_0004501 [Colletotrichum scovillei]KAG7079917.1 hypothetical protein JMJ78_0007020 [Colletotrichum scovillei]
MQFFKIFICNILCLSLALAGVIDDGSTRGITSDTEDQELKRTVPEPAITTTNSDEMLLLDSMNAGRATFEKLFIETEERQGGNPNSRRDLESHTTDVEISEHALNLTGRADLPTMSDAFAYCVTCVWACKVATDSLNLGQSKQFHRCFWVECFGGSNACADHLMDWAKFVRGGIDEFPTAAQFKQAWQQFWRPLYEPLNKKAIEEEE